MSSSGRSVAPYWLLQSVDEVAVERVVRGDTTVRLNIAERVEAVRQLDARRVGQTEIARRLGVTLRTVARARARLREQS